MTEFHERKFIGNLGLNFEKTELLAKFLFDPRNASLKKTFEKAANVELEWVYGHFAFYADKEAFVAPAKAALEDLAGNLKVSVEKGTFKAILGKLAQ